MALSHAHHTVRDLTHVLEARKIQVTFGVHPLAGRMPGHMNVLLEEGGIPDDKVKPFDEINSSFAKTDVVVVVGASDVVNPLAPTEPASPMAGLPVLEVGNARHVLVVKRGSGLGLSICRKLVEAMGSTLQVETEQGAGTRFYFELDLPLAGDAHVG